MTSSQQQFMFPLLSEKEIVQCLHEIGMRTVTVDHVVKPTYETVQPIYETLVCMLCGISRYACMAIKSVGW